MLTKQRAARKSGQSLQAATPAQHPGAHEQQNRLQLVPQSLPLPPMILNCPEGFSQTSHGLLQPSILRAF